MAIAVWPRAGREALHFDDESTLIFQRGRHLIQCSLGVLAQDALAGTETDFSLGRSLVLVDVADNLLDGGQAGVGLGGSLVRQGRLVAGINGVLVSFVGFRGSQTDAFGRARIDIFDLSWCWTRSAHRAR